MSDQYSTQQEIASYIGKLLRDNFGRGPTSVHVSLAPPYMVVHLRDFLAPMEKILVNQNETKRVEETRDLLMSQLISEIRLQVSQLTDIQLDEMYFDWNLNNKSGLILGTIASTTEEHDFSWPAHVSQTKFQERIKEMSEWAQKIPHSISTYWLHEKIIVIRRTGVFVQIEKELINAGHTEILKTVKRPMERRMILQAKLDQILRMSIAETFLAWDFRGDKGYIVLILQNSDNAYLKKQL